MTIDLRSGAVTRPGTARSQVAGRVQANGVAFGDHSTVGSSAGRWTESFLALAFGVILLFSVVGGAFAETVVPGVASSQLEPKLKGLVLIEELNCVACHKGGTSLESRSKKAPRLSEVGARVNPAYLESFIGNPHGTQPGTAMPDLLAQFGVEEKKRVATAITHFLLSLKENDFAPQPPDHVAAEHGKRLFHSRGCAACHSPRDDQGTEWLASTSSPLGALERKYSFESLVDFLRQPHASRPSGRMPEMGLPGRDVERIAHYLLRETRVPGALRYTLYRGDVWEGLESDQVTAERGGHVKDFDWAGLGKPQHHTAVKYEGWINVPHPGRHTFFLTMNGGSLALDGRRIVQLDPSDRRGVRALEGAIELAPGPHAIELTYFHTGREPKFLCGMEGPGFARGPIPSSWLSVSKDPIAPFAPVKVDAGLAALGREQFGKLGCANCHDDLGLAGQASTGLAKLAAGRGCLSEASGPWPRFDLNAQQRGWMAEALTRAENPQLNDQEQIEKTLVTFNCIACHERTGLGGIAPERNALFTGTQPALGDQGRLPPPLSHVGAKLTPAWLAEVMLHGKRQREYLDASMPQFGEANVGPLVELFGKVDALETVTLPKVVDPQVSKAAGHEMIGTTGLSCIVCHEFNGQRSGEVSALDLVPVTGRLQKNWFHLYLRQPSRFHANVIMPTYWPDGQSVRPNILDGDAGQQIEALWLYLEDGSRAKRPAGLSRQLGEIRVGDVTEICRGQSPVGYRGIGVGYPERINLAFDSGEMALRQLWKGDFVSVDSGHFRPRGTDSIAFPPGIPFHRLKSMEDHWPYKGKSNHAFPQDHGYQFRGYHLDAARRPTLLYHYGDIAVADFFEDLRESGGPAYFKRTLSFETAAPQPLFYFRAAAGRKITRQSERSFAVDKLQLRVTSDHPGIVREGGAGELLIPLTLSPGRSTLTLEYRW